MMGYGNGTWTWGDWLGMSIAVTAWTVLVIVLAVWVARVFTPSSNAAGAALEARLAGMEAEVARLREQAHLTHRDGAGSRS